MPLTLSRFALWGRMTLPVLVAAAFFGPSIAAFATSRPVVAVPENPPIPVISVHPFLNLAADSCSPNPPIHDGPHEQTGQLSHREALDSRMLAAAVTCLGPTSGFLTLSVSVDADGNLREIQADTGADDALANCATTFVHRGGRLETRGPGTLMIGYYVAHRGS
jgi:hypothetical protein